jgi:molecular chaperone HscA
MALLQIHEPGQSDENQTSEEIIIGIDLGTTNSLVGVVENEKVRILADENGRDIFPSIVKYGDVEIHSIKRLMGKGKDVRVDAGDRKIRPEEVSSEILKQLKKIAEKNLGKEIKKAVITVPAYFDEAAKNATKLAANLADLEVVRLVNEPTAAALAYGLENSSEGIYCVYDLGGGTFDVSILKMQKGVFKVLGVAGDNHLGGDDFDNLLVGAALAAARGQAQGLPLQIARKIKEELSLKDFSNGFSRTDFENLISEKIEKTTTLTKNLIEDLDLSAEEIKGIILVGGSTRIPLVRKKLAEIFGEKKVLTDLDPDRVVAIGAAWQAYNLSGGGKNLLLDVTALSLGIEMMGGITDKIIQRNSTIPIAKAKEFTTYADNQTGMKLHIVQGERELASDCRSLANFEIKGIPPMKAGMARVVVTFRVDADGLLTVSAEEKITKTKQEIEVRPTFSLDQSEIKKMLLDSLKNSQADIENRLLIEAATEAMQDAVIIEKDLKSFVGEEKENIAEKLEILKKLISEKTNRDAILLAQQELGKAAENLVLQKVNAVLKEKIAGKKVDEV